MKNDTQKKISVYLVDDQNLLRAAIRSLLEQEGRFEIAGESNDARRAVEEVAELRPDVVLLDIAMPGLSGLDIIQPLKRAYSRVRILMLTHHEGESFVEQALQLGADGYLSKDSDSVELALGIGAVAEGRPFLSPRVSGGLLAKSRGAESVATGAPSRIGSLTPREREVFQLLAIGSTNKEVASNLGMSLGTAKKHRENLQRKLDCHSAAELARLAIREGLLAE
jgi:DNA-binding NarL/FixJ family response regulator